MPSGGLTVVKSKEEHLEALRKLSELLGGYRPTSADLLSPLAKEAGCQCHAVYQKYFGSFQNALKEAGLDKLPKKKLLEKAGIDLKKRKVLFSPEVKKLRLPDERIIENYGIRIFPRHVRNKSLMDFIRLYYGEEVDGVRITKREILRLLSSKEYGMLSAFAEGKTYSEIAEIYHEDMDTLRIKIARIARKALNRIYLRKNKQGIDRKKKIIVYYQRGAVCPQKAEK